MKEPTCFNCDKPIPTLTCYRCNNCKTIYCQDCNRRLKHICIRCKPKLVCCATDELGDITDRNYHLYKNNKKNYPAKYKCPKCKYSEGIRESNFNLIKSLNANRISCYACGYTDCEIKLLNKEKKVKRND